MARQPGPNGIAGGDIGIGRVVKGDITADHTFIQATAATDHLLGIAKRAQRDTPGLTGSNDTLAGSAGDAIEIASEGEVYPARVGASQTTTRGKWQTAHTDGGIKDATLSTTGACIGIAQESGTDGAEVELFILPIPPRA